MISIISFELQGIQTFLYILPCTSYIHFNYNHFILSRDIVFIIEIVNLQVLIMMTILIEFANFYQHFEFDNLNLCHYYICLSLQIIFCRVMLIFSERLFIRAILLSQIARCLDNQLLVTKFVLNYNYLGVTFKYLEENCQFIKLVLMVMLAQDLEQNTVKLQLKLLHLTFCWKKISNYELVIFGMQIDELLVILSFHSNSSVVDFYNLLYQQIKPQCLKCILLLDIYKFDVTSAPSAFIQCLNNYENLSYCICIQQQQIQMTSKLFKSKINYLLGQQECNHNFYHLQRPCCFKSQQQLLSVGLCLTFFINLQQYWLISCLLLPLQYLTQQERVLIFLQLQNLDSKNYLLMLFYNCTIRYYMFFNVSVLNCSNELKLKYFLLKYYQSTFIAITKIFLSTLMVIKIISCEVRQLDTAYNGGQILNCKIQQLISVYILIKSKGQCGSFFLTDRKSIRVNTNKIFIKCINLSLSIPAKLLLPIQIDQKTSKTQQILVVLNLLSTTLTYYFTHHFRNGINNPSIQILHMIIKYSSSGAILSTFSTKLYHILKNTFERILIIFMLGKAKYIFNNQNLIDQLIAGTQFENYNIARGKKFTARFYRYPNSTTQSYQQTHSFFKSYASSISYQYKSQKHKRFFLQRLIVSRKSHQYSYLIQDICQATTESGLYQQILNATSDTFTDCYMFTQQYEQHCQDIAKYDSYTVQNQMQKLLHENDQQFSMYIICKIYTSRQVKGNFSERKIIAITDKQTFCQHQRFEPLETKRLFKIINPLSNANFSQHFMCIKCKVQCYRMEFYFQKTNCGSFKKSRQREMKTPRTRNTLFRIINRNLGNAKDLSTLSQYFEELFEHQLLLGVDVQFKQNQSQRTTFVPSNIILIRLQFLHNTIQWLAIFIQQLLASNETRLSIHHRLRITIFYQSHQCNLCVNKRINKLAMLLGLSVQISVPWFLFDNIKQTLKYCLMCQDRVALILRDFFQFRSIGLELVRQILAYFIPFQYEFLRIIFSMTR
ncbi:unnamed protein product (macronuclear) [Paramecium tetraurelia]|uniref:Transmembrane protein n=1 Tax=Paramecium tetraurelia TaxID=5888 RepID=A0BM83_PARTE|nr:uncharacterized protein GSPATT00030284001 [Paramecium tetraurelia]CAK59650.1 unnamed protein product [Paramecium tetraurelia]|eukprot:XP_001427048.1 hypothetical protein (macronuclear) [Paramecium tetraurelia strain d4-2]